MWKNETVYRVLLFILNCKPALGQKVCTRGGGRLNINKISFLPLINVSKQYIFLIEIHITEALIH